MAYVFLLDIVIPDLNLAIEFNGVYYHSIEARNTIWLSLNEKTKNDLLKIFNNKNLILFEDENQIIFDRCNISLNDLRIIFNKNKIKETKPQLILRDRYHVEDCGKLIVIK